MSDKEVCPTCGSAKKREFIWTYSTVNSGCTPKAHDSWHDEKVDSLPTCPRCGHDERAVIISRSKGVFDCPESCHDSLPVGGTIGLDGDTRRCCNDPECGNDWPCAAHPDRFTVEATPQTPTIVTFATATLISHGDACHFKHEPCSLCELGVDSLPVEAPPSSPLVRYVDSLFNHVAPDRQAIENNRKVEPEGERLRRELEEWLERNHIVTVDLDTDRHTVTVNIAKLPPEIKPVLTLWGCIYVENNDWGVEAKPASDPDWKALAKLAARVILQHLNNEDYEMSFAGLYARLTEHEMDAEPASKEEARMTDVQIKHMVERFLGWRLPENFTPDAGISFKRDFNENTSHPMKHEPTGTNLFDFTQAEAMVRYMVEGLAESRAEQPNVP